MAIVKKVSRRRVETVTHMCALAGDPARVTCACGWYANPVVLRVQWFEATNHLETITRIQSVTIARLTAALEQIVAIAKEARQ